MAAAHPGAWRPPGPRRGWREKGRSEPAVRPTPGKEHTGPAGAAAVLRRPRWLYVGLDLLIPAQLRYNLARWSCNPAWASLFWSGKSYSGLGYCLLTFLISCIYNSSYITYIRHNIKVLWYTRGYIPDISPRGCGRLVGSRTGFNKKYTKVPNLHTHEADMLACTGQILSHANIGNVLFDIYSYT
jgi:hypothetical protein